VFKDMWVKLYNLSYFLLGNKLRAQGLGQSSTVLFLKGGTRQNGRNWQAAGWDNRNFH